MGFRILIPARYHSERLPGKALMNIAGKPMIQHVYECAIKSGADSVAIATGDRQIAQVAHQFGAFCVITDGAHKTGTDRIAQACRILRYHEQELVVCLQCDEPLITPLVIQQLVADLDKYRHFKVASLCVPITSSEELFDSNVVKVVLNHQQNAIYFSRAPIPWQRGVFDNKNKTIKLDHCFRHVGLYAYRVGFLMDYVRWTDVPIENMECLEQLRILWHGDQIHMVLYKHSIPCGVDTEEDLRRVRQLLS